MIKYLTEPQQRELLKAARTQADPLAQRDYHWMSVLILTGMRITEFSHLTVPQVRLALATGWLVSKKDVCKGKKQANDYCVTAQLRVHLQALIHLSDELQDGQAMPARGQPLIWGRAGDARPRPRRVHAPVLGIQVAEPDKKDKRPTPEGALSVRSYEARLKEWAIAAGLDSRISPHWLRHTRGMNVMKNCRGANPLLVAQRALNHKSLKSTGVYMHLNREELAQQLQMVDARGRMGKADARKLAAEGACV